MRTVKIRNKQIAIEILGHVLRKLESIQHTYGVCFVVFEILHHVGGSDKEREQTAQDLCKWISNLLGYWAGYQAWLRYNCEEYRKLDIEAGIQAAREGRIAWVKWMIQELESLI